MYEMTNLNGVSGATMWKRGDGRNVYVADMSVTHIKNALRCWNGQGLTEYPPNYNGGRDIWIPIFENELLNRQIT